MSADLLRRAAAKLRENANAGAENVAHAYLGEP